MFLITFPHELLLASPVRLNRLAAGVFCSLCFEERHTFPEHVHFLRKPVFVIRLTACAYLFKHQIVGEHTDIQNGGCILSRPTKETRLVIKTMSNNCLYLSTRLYVVDLILYLHIVLRTVGQNEGQHMYICLCPCVYKVII